MLCPVAGDSVLVWVVETVSTVLVNDVVIERFVARRIQPDAVVLVQVSGVSGLKS